MISQDQILSNSHKIG